MDAPDNLFVRVPKAQEGEYLDAPADLLRSLVGWVFRPSFSADESTH